MLILVTISKGKAEGEGAAFPFSYRMLGNKWWYTEPVPMSRSLFFTDGDPDFAVGVVFFVWIHFCK